MRMSRQIMSLNSGLIKADSFTYTGDYNFIEEPRGQWHIEFLTSGTLIFKKSTHIDIFCIGGGGGGGSSSERHSSVEGGYGGGGGGGYGAVQRDVNLVSNQPILITIGQGGAGGKHRNGQNTPGGDGGVSSFGDVVHANGGKGALGYYGRTAAGGVGGNNGGEGRMNGGQNGFYGSILTKYFQEQDGQDYAGGGGGGGHGGSQGGLGYAGGGNGGGPSHQTGFPATANSGGGGGGASEYYGDFNGGAGGSGIVIIRNRR